MKHITWLAIIVLSLYSCKPEPKIVMTSRYLETDFSLINGIKIDELRVDSFSEDHLPYVFYLKESLHLGRYQQASHKEYLKNVIFFDRPNADYLWRNDSAWGNFTISVVEYKYRGNISSKDRMDDSYQQQFPVFPRKFKPNSWYLIDFLPAEVGKKNHEFMYADNEGRFTFYKLRGNR
jgi:hypothetical protein